ncbi:hypothetical protein CBP51_19330 [Cellvibrio mixtus]|uniref:Type VI secretion system (T6SS), amidase effector protein 4 n=1 Tax=Cellvibrio mixtus TaxID=39650 RepID=A0A266Q261_9GAMM|nr:T6SS effector amidase Tae4 family protein [Cellvibrio mixtus]OZY83948.1 hypothetical protein CBP51_19330 [Cellvibrio mixtus]
MSQIKFEDLWKYYPKDAPCDKKSFSNQCAIKVGSALSKCGVKTTTLVPKSRHCWHHKESEGHVLSANELAAGLRKAKILGISAAIEIDAVNFKAQIAGKKGIIYFEDYWLRTEDRPERPTGDHIDLWNGARLTDVTSWLRVQLGISYEGVWSDFEKSKKILFWQVAA